MSPSTLGSFILQTKQEENLVFRNVVHLKSTFRSECSIRYRVWQILTTRNESLFYPSGNNTSYYSPKNISRRWKKSRPVRAGDKENKLRHICSSLYVKDLLSTRQRNALGDNKLNEPPAAIIIHSPPFPLFVIPNKKKWNSRNKLFCFLFLRHGRTERFRLYGKKQDFMNKTDINERNPSSIVRLDEEPEIVPVDEEGTGV